MNIIRSSGLITGALLMAAPLFGQANNGHFMVDHAVVADPGRCQTETWLSRDDSNSISTLVDAPACTLAVGWQFRVPLSYDPDNSRFAGADLQLKRIIASGHNFGDIALTLGTNYNNDSERLERTYVNLPWSAEVTPNMTIHLNAGLSHVRVTRNLKTNWGLASSYHFTDSVDLILEGASFGSDSPALAAGMRLRLQSGLELDASVGRDIERDRDLLNIGINFRF
jgi:hypothetical protein